MSKSYSIQQVATLTGLSIDTLRYYERVGLLAPVPRNGSGHRRYSEDRLAGIKFVLKLRATGMSVAKLHHYIALARRGEQTVCERRALLEEHAESIRLQIEQLSKTQQAIEHKLAHFDEIEAQVNKWNKRVRSAQQATGGSQSASVPNTRAAKVAP